MYYVTMTDTYLSGWGMADNKTNKLIIECKTYEEALIIEHNARKRPEMKYVSITSKRPRFGSNVFPSWETFETLGQIWKQ